MVGLFAAGAGLQAIWGKGFLERLLGKRDDINAAGRVNLFRAFYGFLFWVCVVVEAIGVALYVWPS